MDTNEAMETLSLIYSLEYYIEDVNTTTRNVLAIIVPELSSLAVIDGPRARALASSLLDAIGQKALDSDDLRECFSGFDETVKALTESESKP